MHGHCKNKKLSISCAYVHPLCVVRVLKNTKNRKDHERRKTRENTKS
jgi:hypothetical protein